MSIATYSASGALPAWRVGEFVHTPVFPSATYAPWLADQLLHNQQSLIMISIMFHRRCDVAD